GASDEGFSFSFSCSLFGVGVESAISLILVLRILMQHDRNVISEVVAPHGRRKLSGKALVGPVSTKGSNKCPCGKKQQQSSVSRSDLAMECQRVADKPECNQQHYTIKKFNSSPGQRVGMNSQ